MSRLPGLRWPDLEPAQRKVWHGVTGSERSRAHQSSGGHAAELGAAVRFRSSLDRRLLELAVVVAVHWRSNSEFWAGLWFHHVRLDLGHFNDETPATGRTSASYRIP